MGCTESILSEMAAKSNQTRSTRTQKVEPALLRGDTDLEGARERRRQLVAKRRSKAQAMAQTISENAMMEKERLSNSTWRSYRSGSQGDALSPTATVSFLGSDGTASLENFPNPATAYESKCKDDNTPDRQEDINADEMQIRTLTLPNQVAQHAAHEGSVGTPSRGVVRTEVEEEGAGKESDGRRHRIERREKNQGAREGLEDTRKVKEGCPESSEGQDRSPASQGSGEERVLGGDGGKDGEAQEEENRADQSRGLLKEKHKVKGKHKGRVKFSDQATGDGESLDTGRKSTSQGR